MVKFKNRKKKGQSTLEYILLLAGVVAIMIIFLNPTTGLFSQAYNRTLQSSTNGMEFMGARIAQTNRY